MCMLISSISIIIIFQCVIETVAAEKTKLSSYQNIIQAQANPQGKTRGMQK